MTIQDAERLFQLAYNIDNGIVVGEVDLSGLDPKEYVIDLNEVIYNSQICAIPEVRELLLKGGQMRKIVDWLIEQRVSRGEYKESTLRKMYLGS